MLEHILSHEECDVDPLNRLDKQTPLHLAAQIEELEMRKFVIEELLEAGADATYVHLLYLAATISNRCPACIRIKDKHGQLALYYVPRDDTETRALFRKAQAQASISKDDIANGKRALCLSFTPTEQCCR